MTAQRTIRPHLSPKSKCHIGTWNVRTTLHGNNAKKMEVAWACYQERLRQHNTNCIKVDTGQWKKEERSPTRNLEEDDRGKHENSREDMERTWEGSNGQGAMEISGLSLMCHLGAMRIIYT